MRRCNCIALYGEKKESYDVSKWYTITLDFFDSLGYKPNLGGLSAKGYSPGKAITFKNLNKKLIARDFKDIDSISLFTTFENFKTLLDGWYVHSLLYLEQFLTLFCFDADVHSFDRSFIHKYVVNMAPYVDIKYGIGYQRNYKLGPAEYSFGCICGLGYSPEDEVEADKIAKWSWISNENENHLHGKLRDIYPINIVSEIHLNKEIRGKTLEQWIQNEGMGELYPINDLLWMWQIDDELIDHARLVLKPTGIILCI